MVNHGLVVAPLLFIVALLAQRAGGSEDIREMGGIAFRAPVLATLFLIVALATLAMPGSSNFVGEFLILLGVFNAKLVIAIIAFSGVVMASVYALRLFIRSMHNRVGRADRLARDGAARRASCWCRSSRVIVFLALYPQLALQRSEGSVKTTVASRRPFKQGLQTARCHRRVERFASLPGAGRTARTPAQSRNAPASSTPGARSAPRDGPPQRARTSTSRGSRRSIALLGGAVLVLMVGLLALTLGAHAGRARR